MSKSHFCVHHNPDLTPEKRRRLLSPRWAQVAEAQESGALDEMRKKLGDA